MPLSNLLYRCPKCGEDPTQGEKDEVWCHTCGTRFSRGGEGGRIRVVESDGTTWEVPSHRLSATLDAMGGPHTRGWSGGKGLSYRALVQVRIADTEEPVWHRGELFGFAERFGAPLEGSLHLTLEGLSFRAPSAPSRAPWSWALLDIRAVQTSSSALQISPRGGGLVQFRFPDDSPRRWEELLKGALRKGYRAAGLGEIVEFQPRIVTEKP